MSPLSNLHQIHGKDTPASKAGEELPPPVLNSVK